MGRRKRREASTTLGPSIILLFVLEAGEQNVPGAQEAAGRLTGRQFEAYSIVHVLDQLAWKGFVETELRPRPDWHGRRRYYRIAPAGREALAEIRRIIEATKVPGSWK